VAVLDADVLVPILSCDLLLSAFDHDLYVPAVTPRILEEVERTLLTDFARLDPVPLRGRAGHVRTALRFHTHPDSELSDGVARVNPKDRHVAALALVVGADVVVSNDRRLRRQLQGLDPPVTALTADDLALRLLDQDRQAMTGVLDAMVAKRPRRDPRSGVSHVDIAT
jgi:predicted nucleic acid-binding protein